MGRLRAEHYQSIEALAEVSLLNRVYRRALRGWGSDLQNMPDFMPHERLATAARSELAVIS